MLVTLLGKKGEERDFKAEESGSEQMVNSEIGFGLWSSPVNEKQNRMKN